MKTECLRMLRLWSRNTELDFAGMGVPGKAQDSDLFGPEYAQQTTVVRADRI